MNDLEILKRRCEDECFDFLKEQISVADDNDLRAFIETDEFVQNIIKDMMTCLIYDFPLRELLLNVLIDYQRKQGNNYA